MAGTICYTETATIFVPEREFESLPYGWEAVPLRGSAHTQAVMNRQRICMGWILTENV